MSVFLTLNAGSSSIKFSAYRLNGGLSLQARGQVAAIGAEAILTIDRQGRKESRGVRAPDYQGALASILGALEPDLQGRAVAGVGHRIVHGGDWFVKPTVLTGDVVERLADLEPLAPLHQPQNLRGVEAARRAFPGALQVGCFDTSFHQGQERINRAFALPRRFYDAGVKRYGFHGLSYQYISQTLRRDRPGLADGRIVVAHLGNGASMCAMRGGASVATTMGFSALEGLPMGTRCGQIDPGVILYFIDKGMSHTELTTLLYQESGLSGLSGVSNDMRTLLASDAPEAREAVDYFAYRIRCEIGRMAAALGGIDGLVFCGGIGERAPAVRRQAIEGLGFLGLAVDAAANERNAATIGAGPVPIFVTPTDEERVIAEATVALVAESAPGHAPGRAPDAARLESLR